MKLKTYLNQCGNGSQKRLATSLNIKPSSVCYWANGQREIPVLKCLPIERATNGRVTRKDLRPEDWHIHWPELENRTAEVIG